MRRVWPIFAITFVVDLFCFLLYLLKTSNLEYLKSSSSVLNFLIPATFIIFIMVLPAYFFAHKMFSSDSSPKTRKTGANGLIVTGSLLMAGGIIGGFIVEFTVNFTGPKVPNIGLTVGGALFATGMLLVAISRLKD